MSSSQTLLSFPTLLSSLIIYILIKLSIRRVVKSVKSPLLNLQVGHYNLSTYLVGPDYTNHSFPEGTSALRGRTLRRLGKKIPLSGRTNWYMT